MQDQMRKFEENAELKKASVESVEELSKHHTRKFMYQQLLLGAPDSYLRRKLGPRSNTLPDDLCHAAG